MAKTIMAKIWQAGRSPDPKEVSPEAVRLHLQKILSSPEMATAARLQQFLTFVVEQKLNGADSIKETELAIEVFHRRASFDPVGDSVVRIAASNLRHRLREYYERSGSQDTLIIEIPKGSYVPVFRHGAPGLKPRRKWPLAAAIVAAVCLAGACGAGRSSRIRRRKSRPSPCCRSSI